MLLMQDRVDLHIVLSSYDCLPSIGRMNTIPERLRELLGFRCIRITDHGTLVVVTYPLPMYSIASASPSTKPSSPHLSWATSNRICIVYPTPDIACFQFALLFFEELNLSLPIRI